MKLVYGFRLNIEMPFEYLMKQRFISMHIPAVFTKMTSLILIEKSSRIISENGLYSESVIYVSKFSNTCWR